MLKAKGWRENLSKLGYPLLGIGLIWVIFLSRIFANQTSLGLPLVSDIGWQWIPFKEYTHWAFSQGYFPLWCPYLFAGMPFLAFSHTQVVYPLGLLLTFFEYAKAVNFYYPVHLSIGFLGLYLLLRNFSISRFSSLLASFSIILSGKFFYVIHHLPTTTANFWGIWFFYFLVKLAQKKKLSSFFGLSIVFCLELLAGDMEGASYQLLFTPFFFLLVIPEKPKLKNPLWLILFFSIFMGILLASIQFVPIFEYSAHFVRKVGFSPKYKTYNLLAQPIWAFIFPLKGKYLFGMDENTPYFYAGLLALFFPFYALVSKPRPVGIFLLAVLALLLGLRIPKIIDWIIFYIPFLNLFKSIAHYLFLSQIFFGILLGIGLDRARKSTFSLIIFLGFAIIFLVVQTRFFETLGAKKILLFLSIISFLLLLFFRLGKKNYLALKLIPSILFFIFFFDTYWLAFTTAPRNPFQSYELSESLKMFKNTFSQKGDRSVAISKFSLNDPILLHHFGLRTRISNITGWVGVPPFTYASFLNLIDPRSLELDKGKIKSFGFTVLFWEGKFIKAETFPLLNLLSLRYFLVNGLNPKFASPYGFAKAITSTSSSQKIILEQTSEEQNLVLSGDTTLSFELYIETGDILKSGLKIESPNPNQEFMIIVQSQKAEEIIHQQKPIHSQSEITIALDKYANQHLKIKFATKGFSSEQSLTLLEPRIENKNKPIQRIYKGEIEIFENKEAFPEGFIVHNAQWFEDEEQILSALSKSSSYDLREKIYLSKFSPTAQFVSQVGAELRAKGIDPINLKEPVHKITDRGEYLAFRVYLLAPGYLFLNHQYLPGWRVFVDGKEGIIERADYCFRAVFLDKGEHLVEFKYQPIGFRLGLWISLCSWLMLIIITVSIFLFREKQI